MDEEETPSRSLDDEYSSDEDADDDGQFSDEDTDPASIPRGSARDRMKRQQEKGRTPKVGVKNLEEILAEAKRLPVSPAIERVTPAKPAAPAAQKPPIAAAAGYPTGHTGSTVPGANASKLKQPFSWIASRTISETKHAKVSKGFNFDLGQSVVIKQYTLFDVTAEMRQERYDLIERIEREITRAAKQLPTHEHIIHYIDSLFNDNSLYVFTEFVAGGSVEGVLREADRLEESVIKRYTKQILQAISHLHGKGFFNLNIKVSNMLLDNQGNIKLCDYVATQELSDLEANVFRTNMDYFIHQDERSKEAQQRKTDIQSIGWSIIEMATGSKDQRALPESFSKEAKNFVDTCIKGYATAPPAVEICPRHPLTPSSLLPGRWIR